MSNTKRSGKFYRKNEREVMEQLGLQPTKNSGSGWIEKEDGQNEYVLCQLKSTDAASIKIAKQDLDTLAYNCSVSHKLPVFAIQFLQSEEVYLVLKPEVLEDVAKYIRTGNYIADDMFGICAAGENAMYTSDTPNNTKPTIRSSSRGRERFEQERLEKYRKHKSAT